MSKFISSSNDIADYKSSVLAKSETNDCSVRALASGFGLSYDDSHNLLKTQMSRPNRKGVQNSQLIKWILSSPVINNKTIIPVDKKSYTYDGSQRFINEKNPTKSKPIKIVVRQMIENFPVGTYLVSVRNHVFILRDGTVIGNHDDAIKQRVKVLGLFKIEEV